MLISYMDQLARSAQFDLELDRDVDVYLVGLKGFTEDKGLAEWTVLEEESVSRNLLHYNDTADGSNKLNGSWREFYASECEFGEKSLFNGSAIFFKDGLPNFRGIAKAVMYLRYSRGFLNWLKHFDSKASEEIKKEVPKFEGLIDNPKTKKLKTSWDKFKAPRRKWALPVVCGLTDGTTIIFGLRDADDADWEPLEDLGVNVERSLELMSLFDEPTVADKEIISEVLQMGAGLGRNAFGKTYDLGAIRDSEYIRLMGYTPEACRKDILDVWGNRLDYRIKVAPNPDTSSIILTPEGELSYSHLKRFVDSENRKKTVYFEEKKNRKKGNEDTEPVIAERPSAILTHWRATLFLVNVEGAQKKKLIIQQVFPSVSLRYLSNLNEELLHSNTQNSVVRYMKTALTGQERDTPSIYRYWTTVFTSALQMNYISAIEVYNYFQRFCKCLSSDHLVGKRKQAREYFRVVARLRRLQYLIYTAREFPASLDTLELTTELNAVEDNQLIRKGVFGMTKEPPNSQDLVGDVYNLLRDYEQEKLDAFIRFATQSVPDDDFATFIRGALVGILLNELSWIVKSEGRSFAVTQGRHPSTLRGKQIEAVVTKGVGLLINLDVQHRFNCRTLPFIKSCTTESLKDAFNSGLIMGLVFTHKTQEKEKENNDQDIPA